jgi:dynein heavy chain
VHNDLYLETQKGLEEFMKETSDSKIVFQINAPYQATNMDNDQAFMRLNEYKENAKTLRKREETMKFGFDLFKINYVPSPDLEYVEKEI